MFGDYQDPHTMGAAYHGKQDKTPVKQQVPPQYQQQQQQAPPQYQYEQQQICGGVWVG